MPPTATGRGTQSAVVKGTFTVIPEGNEPTDGFVTLSLSGMIDGFIRVETKPGTKSPSAALKASIEVFQKKFTGRAMTSGTMTETQGVKGELPLPPGITISENKSSQVSSQGTTPSLINARFKVPIGVDIGWSFEFSLLGEVLDKETVGRAVLTKQFVNLTVEGLHPKGLDPFYSSSMFSFDAATGELTVQHPSSQLGVITVPSPPDDTGNPPPPLEVDYSHFMPEVEAILVQDKFLSEDALLGALLRYSGMFLDEARSDGTVTFTDGLLEFLDPTDRDVVLATMEIKNIVANPATEMFSAGFANFTPVALAVSRSTLARNILGSGGFTRVWFDPGIISASKGFTESATSGPFPIDGTPDEIPPTCEFFASGGVLTTTAQDKDSGLGNIVVVSSRNTDRLVGSLVAGFLLGQTTPFRFNTHKLDNAQSASILFEVRDVAGNLTACDPEIVTLRIGTRGRSPIESVANIPAREHKLTVHNETPGLRRLLVTVNGVKFRMTELADGERRTLDISSAMLPGRQNIVTLRGLGRSGSSATILIHDGR